MCSFILLFSPALPSFFLFSFLFPFLFFFLSCFLFLCLFASVVCVYSFVVQSRWPAATKQRRAWLVAEQKNFFCALFTHVESFIFVWKQLNHFTSVGKLYFVPYFLSLSYFSFSFFNIFPRFFFFSIVHVRCDAGVVSALLASFFLAEVQSPPENDAGNRDASDWEQQLFSISSSRKQTQEKNKRRRRRRRRRK